MAKRGKIQEIDVVRAIAIMAVVAIHSTTNPIVNLDPHSFMYPVYSSINTFSSFTVPTFIFLSGLVLFYNYFPRNFGWKAVKEFYFKRIMFIAIPYITISLMYYFLNGYYVGQPFGEFVLDFTDKLLRGKNHYHLYFMVAIIQFYLIFPIVLGLLKRFKWLAKNSFWLGILGQWLFWYINSHYLHQTRTSVIPFTYFSYFFVGAYIGIYYEQAKSWLFDRVDVISFGKKVFRVALLVVWLGSSIFYVYLFYRSRIGEALDVPGVTYTIFFNVFALTSALVFTQLAFYLFRRFDGALFLKGLTVLGMISFGVYFIHPFFYIYYNPYISSDPFLYHMMIAGKFLVGVICSWIVVYYANRYLPFSWVIFGKIPGKKRKK